VCPQELKSFVSGTQQHLCLVDNGEATGLFLRSVLSGVYIKEATTRAEEAHKTTDFVGTCLEPLAKHVAAPAPAHGQLSKDLARTKRRLESSKPTNHAAVQFNIEGSCTVTPGSD